MYSTGKSLPVLYTTLEGRDEEPMAEFVPKPDIWNNRNTATKWGLPIFPNTRKAREFQQKIILPCYAFFIDRKHKYIVNVSKLNWMKHIIWNLTADGNSPYSKIISVLQTAYSKLIQLVVLNCQRQQDSYTWPWLVSK